MNPGLICNKTGLVCRYDEDHQHKNKST